MLVHNQHVADGTPISGDSMLRVPEHVLSRRAGAETVILSLDDERYYGLDGVGTRFWEIVEPATTFGEASLRCSKSTRSSATSPMTDRDCPGPAEEPLARRRCDVGSPACARLALRNGTSCSLPCSSFRPCSCRCTSGVSIRPGRLPDGLAEVPLPPTRKAARVCRGR